MERTILSDEKPYFIWETGNNGIFSIANSFELTESKERNEATLDFEGEKLQKGIDLIETPNRHISHIFRFPKDDFFLSYAVDTIRKHASIADQDYFSIESFGKNMPYKNLCIEGQTQLAEIRPRYFRRLVNN